MDRSRIEILGDQDSERAAARAQSEKMISRDQIREAAMFFLMAISRGPQPTRDANRGLD